MAISVFPVPGGPYRRIPFPGCIPSLSYAGLPSSGTKTSSICLLTSSNPPMSSHVTLGISTRTSLIPLGSTSARASLKSDMVTFMVSRICEGTGLSRSISLILPLRHFMAASLHSAARSAPTNPLVSSARTSMSTSSVRGMSLRWTSRISCLAFLPGTPISISLSNLPGLLKAGSMESSLLVAPITMTFPRSFRPSMRVSSCATTRLSTSPWTESLLGAIESISSRNTMLGAFSDASLKMSLSLSSLCP